MVTGKNSEIAKRERYKGEEERVKSKENRDDVMFVLFWGVFEEQSRRRMDEVW